MKTKHELKKKLKAMDGRGYPNYKDLKGSYDFGDYVFSIDHIQSDPFASPSTVIIEVKNPFDKKLFDTKEKQTAFEDAVLNRFYAALEKANRKRKGKSGQMSVLKPNQAVLKSSVVYSDADILKIRFHISFAAFGRKIDAKTMEKVIFDDLPAIVGSELLKDNLTENQKQYYQDASDLADKQSQIRKKMQEKKLVAFVANGSKLPRAAGNSDKPMENAIPFVSPETLKTTFELEDGTKISGMGIPAGITLIVGGGFHGKSTLLQALEQGVYNHRLHDGREYVLAEPSGLKIRAEDGRSINNVNISDFLKNLPQKKDTVSFSTENASGSTSQAAAISEAAEIGSKLLFMDEDTCATNFMVRDELMEKVVAKDKEPIVPFVHYIRDLYDKDGISTILAAGSSSQFFEPADLIIQMDGYIPEDITEEVKELCRKEGIEPLAPVESLDSLKDKRILEKNPVFNSEKLKIKGRGLDDLSINRESVDIRLLEQLTHPAQVKAIGLMIKDLNDKTDGKTPVAELLDKQQEELAANGMKFFGRSDVMLPRKEETAATLNRMRSAKFSKQ